MGVFYVIVMLAQTLGFGASEEGANKFAARLLLWAIYLRAT
jgi:hypothetical protein